MLTCEIAQRMKSIKRRRGIPQFLIDCGLTSRICEVGVCRGRNFRRLLNCRPDHIVGVDVWRGKIQKSYWRFLSALFDGDRAVELMRAESPKAASSFEDEYFDFVYIDANHSYASVKADMVWWNKVKEGGVFAGHDYTLDKSATSPAQYAKGVIQAVDEFRDKVKPRAWHVTSEPFPSWMMLK